MVVQRELDDWDPFEDMGEKELDPSNPVDALLQKHQERKQREQQGKQETKGKGVIAVGKDEIQSEGSGVSEQNSE